ncbi:type II toxin-antitoxin system Phd/YefM family antitoxin [Geminicoccus flavidas]|uniref:type II toxin-antitoxin system Phd/YefM family antitoxin n=1 Tax=Geminicoccus flavidas TaxID=2506407 RepID=UPI001359D276|nr:type II toxin-antitoxin system prevent-host-death family antitoxin [Geminicoccus flavidas]
MTEVGILEAKTHLSRLIEQVEKGEEVVITRHGKPVARLQPMTSPVKPLDAAALEAEITKLREFRRGRTLQDATLRDLVEDGRRTRE